jgi:hypothetical protein
MWSAEATREYDEGEAVGDGNPNNDLDPSVSEYLAKLTETTAFPEIFITDSRGYAIAANAALATSTRARTTGGFSWRTTYRSSRSTVLLREAKAGIKSPTNHRTVSM